MKNKKFDRRGFLHNLVGLVALGGIGSLILGQKIENVHAQYDIYGDVTDKQIAWGVGAGNSIIDGSDNLKWDYDEKSLIVGIDCTARGKSTVSGGQDNDATGYRSNVGGGYNNEASAESSTVGGGYSNTASGGSSTVGGGYTNTASAERSTVSGGYANTANANYSTVGGGDGNTASAEHSTVGGGDGNTANNSHATVGGGLENNASQQCATVGGGNYNTATHVYSTVAGGNGNDATGSVSTVGGGTANIASGGHSTVPGGRYNAAAGDFSLAAGRRAKIGATHDGTFLFADSTDADFDSARAKEFAVRCTNGARFVADSIFPAVKGENAGTGIGVRAESSSGTALHVEGKNYFKSAQRTTIPTDVRSHVITVPAGITIDTNAMIFVTIMNNSSNIGVRWVERLSDTQFRVHLTGLSRNDMYIGYFIVN